MRARVCGHVARKGHSCSSRFLLAGRGINGPLASAEMYSVETGCWHLLPPMPQAQATVRLATFGDPNRIHALGLVMFVYNRNRNSWEVLKSAKKIAQGGMAVDYDDDLGGITIEKRE